jgi:autophagy-related protein 101
LVQFFHQVKKPTQVPRGLSYFGFGAGREKVEMEDVCWEQWTIDVTLARPRDEEEMRKLRVAMEASLEKAVLKVLSTSCEEKEKVPVGVGKEGEAGGYKIVLGGGTRGRS